MRAEVSEPKMLQTNLQHHELVSGVDEKKITSFRYAVKCPEPASKSLSVHHTMPRTALLPGYGYGGTIDELRRQEFDRLGTTGETSETHHDHQWHSSINIAGPSRDDFPLPVVFMLTRAASW